MVVVDEAYAEFTGRSVIPLRTRYANLAVVRTASKAYALAGLRVGFAVAAPATLARIALYRAPGSIGTISETVVTRALREPAAMLENVARVEAERPAAGGRVRGGGLAALPVGRHASCSWTLGTAPRAAFVADGADAARPRAADVPGGASRPELHPRHGSRPRGERPAARGGARDRARRCPHDHAPGLARGRRARGALDPPAPGDARDHRGGRARARRQRRRRRRRRGSAFYDHLLAAFAHHGLFDLEVRAAGDLEVDEHHTVEDVALVLGAAFGEALGDRAGINRFGDSAVPMDESVATAVIDVGGRPYAVIDLPFRGERAGALPLQLVEHALESFARTAGATLHLRGSGRNDHHLAEAAFKALGRALRVACEPDPRRTGVASTKGSLG